MHESHNRRHQNEVKQHGEVDERDKFDKQIWENEKLLAVMLVAENANVEEDRSRKVTTIYIFEGLEDLPPKTLSRQETGYGMTRILSADP